MATHIKVLKADNGSETLGLKDGDLLPILHDGRNSVFAQSPVGMIEIMKKTGTVFGWDDPNTSPTFEV